MAHITGEVTRFVSAVRRRMGARGAEVWSDNDIVGTGNDVADRIFEEVLLPADKGYGDFYTTISYVADQEMYDLPYGFVKLNEASLIDTSGDKVADLPIISRSEKPVRFGIFLEQREFGISDIPASGTTDRVKLHYTRMPIPMHLGEASAEAAATTLTLAVHAQLGDVLTQNDAYNGCRAQILNATLGEAGISTISDYVGSTHVATVATWGTTPTGVITYEIMPDMPREGFDLWKLDTAIQCLLDEDAGSTAKIGQLMNLSAKALSSLRHVAATRFKRTPRSRDADILIED